MTVVGSTWPTAQAFSNYLGYPQAFTRDYSRLDNIGPNDSAILGVGSGLCSSLKWYLNHPLGAIKAGPVNPALIYPAPGQQTSRFTGAIQSHAQKAVSVRASKWGLPVIAHQHEFDHKGNPGTIQDIVKAGLYANDVARRASKGAALIGCISVDYDEKLLDQFDALYKNADTILIDECYCNDGGKTSAADILGPRILHLRSRYPGKPIGLGEFGCTSGDARPQWLTEALDYFEACDLHLVMYWSSAQYDISQDSKSLQAFAEQANVLHVKELLSRIP